MSLGAKRARQSEGDERRVARRGRERPTALPVAKASAREAALCVVHRGRQPQRGEVVEDRAGLGLAPVVTAGDLRGSRHRGPGRWCWTPPRREGRRPPRRRYDAVVDHQLLEGMVDALCHPVGLRLGHVAEAQPHAPVARLVAEVLRSVLRAMIQPQRPATRYVAARASTDPRQALLDRLQRHEAVAPHAHVAAHHLRAPLFYLEKLASVDRSLGSVDPLENTMIASLEFPLKTQEDLYRVSTFWIAPGASTRPEDWELYLDGTDDIPTGAQRVDDLKHWVLFGEDEYRILTFLSGGKPPIIKKVIREVALAKYFRAVLDRIGTGKDAGGLTWVLMPAIRDPDRRTRYLRALKSAKVDLHILSEPEMVLEYFRLVRGELRLTEGQRSIFLVVDVGASTCNMTFILTRRDQLVVEGTSSKQRIGKLRAIPGNSDEFAGRWVDVEIAKELGLFSESMDEPTRAELLREIERTKCKVARTGKDQVLNSATLQHEQVLSVALLNTIGKRLWRKLVPLFDELCAKLIRQLAPSSSGKSEELQSEDSQRSAPAGMMEQITGVILAGGTSLLPGFEQALREHLQKEPSEFQILRIGADYPIAAAVGGLAHVLKQHYQTPLFRRGRSTKNADDAVEEISLPSLSGALPYDIHFAWKVEGASGTEQSVLAIERQEAIVYEGGVKEIEGLPNIPEGTKLTGRFVPAITAGKGARKGLRPHGLAVNAKPMELKIRWDARLREARGESSSVEGASLLFLHGDRQRTSTASPQVAERSLPPQCVEFSAASDLVVDLGMSKTVAVRAMPGGTVNVAELARVKTDDAVQHELTGILSASKTQDAQIPPAFKRSGAAREHRADYSVSSRISSSALPSSGERSERNLPDEEEAIAEQPTGSESNIVPKSELTSVRQIRRESIVDRATILDQVNQYRSCVSEDSEAARSFASLLLALSVRPMVLIAGPPGCGKSTLARTAARAILGPHFSTAFEEIHVQAHWTRHDVWTEVSKLRNSTEAFYLFDECNLARPEYYMSWLFRRLDEQETAQGDEVSLYVVGTLNIDDSSRPPSPKVLDRCFLLEIDAPADGDRFFDMPQRRPPPSFNPMRRMGSDMVVDEATLGPVKQVIRVLRAIVHERHLRQDLLPSRRVIHDVVRFLSAHQGSGLAEAGILSGSQAVDMLLSSRILIKLAGLSDHLEKVIEELLVLVSAMGLHRSERRLRLAKSQLPFGFVSPWH